MGLIRAMGGAVGGTLADQWKEYFYCEAMDADVLVCKGQKEFQEEAATQKEATILLQMVQLSQ